MEFMRLGVLYMHLLACCVAVGLVLTSDIAMVKQLLGGRAHAADHADHLNQLQVTVARALVVLWVTGVAIIAIDVGDKGSAYFGNPKLQAKIALVLLLTVNGVVLHRTVLPLMQRAGSLLDLRFNQRVVAVFAGSVSAVTWFYAAFIGVGRPLAWKYSLIELLAAYPVLIAGGFFAMLTLTAWAQSRSHEHGGFADTTMVAQ